MHNLILTKFKQINASEQSATLQAEDDKGKTYESVITIPENILSDDIEQSIKTLRIAIVSAISDLNMKVGSK